ncbi:MAG: prolyl oligopeptidase family serine peptidase [Gammaproteobacteria bacterium]|nr:prolyl oligopeptidase family serine peptidase [Gammaproteobacteria bacterium]
MQSNYETNMLSALILVLMSCGCSAAEVVATDHTPTEFTIGEQQHRIIHDGLTRSFTIYTPNSYHSKKPIPLLVFLHGGGGNVERLKKMSNIHALAEKEGFLVAMPKSYNTQWNDGRLTTRNDIDDVQFIDAVVSKIQTTHNVDVKRLYVAGASNGGMMTQRLACERANTYAAFASVIANLPSALKDKCAPTRAVPMLLINGTDDLLMPWQGGEIRKSPFKGAGGQVISSIETVVFWASMNHCDHSAITNHLPDRYPNDGTTIQSYHYENCRDDVTTRLLAIEGGGHTWPGTKSSTQMHRMLPISTQEIDGSEAIWAFFTSHDLP